MSATGTVGDLLQHRQRHLALVTGAHHAVDELALIKALAAAVTLDDDEWERFNDLIGRKALLAGKALAAAADGCALLRRAGINDLALGKAAKRAFHTLHPPCNWFPVTLHNSVQYYITAKLLLHEKFRHIWCFSHQIWRFLR